MSPRISIRLLAAQSDQRLVALAREGHERAFEALVHRYRRPLLRYARRMGLSEARAEDVLQQAFMQSWIALSRGVAVRDARGWLYRIVHNVAVNAMRGPAETYGELTQAVQDRAGLASVSNLERAIAMRDALGDVAALPHMQRQAIFLTAVDGQSHEQVAGALGITPGALRGLLYRARSTLRSAAAALTPPPVLAWACAGSGSGGPSAERLAELTAGAGAAAGVGGVLLKGAVVAVTAGALATGASVLGTHRSGVEHRRGAHVARAEGTGGGSAGFPALASRISTAKGPGGAHPSAFGVPSSGAARHRGRRGRRGGRRGAGGGDRLGSRPGSTLGPRSGSGERRGGQSPQDGGFVLLASDGGAPRLPHGTAGRDGRGETRGGADRQSSDGRDARDGSGRESSLTVGGDGSGDRSGRDGSGAGQSSDGDPREGGPTTIEAALAGTATSPSTAPSEAQQPPASGAAGEDAATGDGGQSANGAGDG